MTPDRFRTCLAALDWSQRGVAALLGIDERQVRRWAAGATIPRHVAEWLDALAQFHEQHPQPVRRMNERGIRDSAAPPDYGLTEPPDLHPFWADHIKTMSDQLAGAQLRLGCVEREQPGLVNAAYRRFAASLVMEMQHPQPDYDPRR
jgi:hypothetical protein